MNMQDNIASSEDMITLERSFWDTLGHSNIYCLIDRYGIGYVGKTSKYSDYFQHFLNKKRSLVRYGCTYDKRLSTMMNESEFEKIILKKSLIKSFEFDDINNSLRIEGLNDTYISYNGHEALGDLDYFNGDMDVCSWAFEQIGLSTAIYINMALRNQRDAVCLRRFSSHFQNKLNDLMSLPFLFEITKKFYYKNRELEVRKQIFEHCGYTNEKIKELNKIINLNSI